MALVGLRVDDSSILMELHIRKRHPRYWSQIAAIVTSTAERNTLLDMSLWCGTSQIAPTYRTCRPGPEENSSRNAKWEHVGLGQKKTLQEMRSDRTRTMHPHDKYGSITYSKYHLQTNKPWNLAWQATALTTITRASVLPDLITRVFRNTVFTEDTTGDNHTVRVPVNTKLLYYIYTMLDQRRRRLADVV